MAQLKDTTVSGNLTASKIIKSGGGSELLVADGTTIAQSSIDAGSVAWDNVTGKPTNGFPPANHDASKITSGTLGVARGGTSKTTAKDAANNFLANLDRATSSDLSDSSCFITSDISSDASTFHRRSTKAIKEFTMSNLPWNKDSIILDSIVLDGTTLKNVEFENVGNGIFLSKNILKGISMYRLLVDDSETYIGADADVGTGIIGRNAAASIEAALKRQFGNSIRLKTYMRTYDGAAHAEKVFVPLESEVFGSGNMPNSKYKTDIYPRWQIPNKNVKTGNNGWWWCANKAPESGDFCAVGRLGDPDVHFLNAYDVDSGVALAFYL